MSRSFLVLSGLALATAIGCGSISNRDNAAIATVSGTLTGKDVPAGTRVALVWHSPNHAWVVSHDVPVVGGAFSFNLTGAPADDLFFTPTDGTSNSAKSPDSTAPTAPTASASASTAPGSSSGSGGRGAGPGGAFVAPRDVVSGSVSTALTAAIAGFVLYVDGNGNGTFDLAGEDGTSPDTIVGGSHELALVYMRDGSSLDFEKLRDKAGQLPTRGYDLMWTSKERWLPLSSVDLVIGDDILPGNVCEIGGVSGSSIDVSPTSDMPSVSGSSAGGGSNGSGSGPDTGGYAWANDGSTAPSISHGPYPSPGDPNLSCSRDGRSWSYDSCRSKSSVPAGLCAQYHPPKCDSYGAGLGNAAPIPTGWPCKVTSFYDGGSSSGSSSDASAGPYDAGSAPTDAGH